MKEFCCDSHFIAQSFKSVNLVIACTVYITGRNEIMHFYFFWGCKGLVTSIEDWGMPSAIAMATEGVRAQYSGGVGGGGFGAADYEVDAKVDCGGQLKLAPVLEFYQYSRSDSLGVRPP